MTGFVGCSFWGEGGLVAQPSNHPLPKAPQELTRCLSERPHE